MLLLYYFLILLLLTPLVVFLYYRTLVFIGENIEPKLFSVSLIILAYLGCVIWFIGGMVVSAFAAQAASNDADASGAFIVAFTAYMIFFLGSAYLAFKKYKPRLEKVNIFFR